MKFVVKNHFSRAALIAGIVSAAWTPSSFACSDSPILASICIMAVPFDFGSFNRQYVLAAGQEIPINANVALYSLIGITYGGNALSTFMVGADGVSYLSGATGGKNAITLTVAQLPPHVSTFTAATVDLTKITISTAVPSLTGTASIASAVVTGTVADLKMNVVNASNGSGTPSGNYLAKASSPPSYIYSSATPDATLNANAISGGTVSVTLPASSAPVTTGGRTVAGVVGGTATASGNTLPVGTGAAIDARPPYIALTYYIAATNGMYPSRD